MMEFIVDDSPTPQQRIKVNRARRTGASMLIETTPPKNSCPFPSQCGILSLKRGKISRNETI